MNPWISLMFRTFTIALATLLFLLPVESSYVFAETHEIKIYSKHPDNKKLRNLFYPTFLKIKAGDTVKFVTVDKGHNTESIDGMIPEGATKWKSKFNKDFEIKLDVPGVYGYKCTPHYAMAMIGLILVEGEGWEKSLEKSKAVNQYGRSKKKFKELFAELEKSVK